MQKNYSVKVDDVDYSSDSDTSSSGEEGTPQPPAPEPPAEIIEVSKRKYVRKKPIDPEAIAEKLAKARANRKPAKQKLQPKQKLEPLEAPEPKIINNYYYTNGRDKEQPPAPPVARMQPPEPQTPRQVPKPAVKPKPIMSFV